MMGVFSETEYRRILDVDILAVGRARADDSNLVIAGEVSNQIDLDDVTRMDATVELLRRAGYAAQGFVAGHDIDPAARAGGLARRPRRSAASVWLATSASRAL